tara:strand:- start:334 stop:465 length:132 start_codon:yes stop_codon:yes gene_type:complete
LLKKEGVSIVANPVLKRKTKKYGVDLLLQKKYIESLRNKVYEK